MLRALRWQAFRRIWIVSFGVGFGYWFSHISFQWLVAQDTDNDPLALSVLYFCLLIPMLLFSLPAGVLADMRDRRSIIRAAQSCVVVISAITGLLVYLDAAPFGALLACAFTAGIAQSFAGPSSQALVANSVPEEDLRSAIVLQSAGMNFTRIFGPAVAGLIIASFGVLDSVLAYGGMAVLTVLAIRGLRIIPTNTQVREPESVGSRIGSAVRHVRDSPPAGTALMLVAATSLFGLSYLSQLPAVAARASPDPSLFVLLLTLGAIGSGVGLLAIGLWPTARPSVTPSALMLAAQAVIVAALGFVTTEWLMIVLVIVGGAAQFGIMTSCNTVIQAVVDDSYRGRVMSLYTMCWGGLMPVGGLLLGVAWHFLGPEAALAGSGLAALVVAGSVLLRPGLQPLPEQA